MREKKLEKESREQVQHYIKEKVRKEQKVTKKEEAQAFVTIFPGQLQQFDMFVEQRYVNIQQFEMSAIQQHFRMNIKLGMSIMQQQFKIAVKFEKWIKQHEYEKWIKQHEYEMPDAKAEVQMNEYESVILMNQYRSVFPEVKIKERMLQHEFEGEAKQHEYGMSKMKAKVQMNEYGSVIRMNQYKSMQLDMCPVSANKRKDDIYAGWLIHTREDKEDDPRKPGKCSIAIKEDDTATPRGSNKGNRTRQNSFEAVTHGTRQPENCGQDVDRKLRYNNESAKSEGRRCRSRDDAAREDVRRISVTTGESAHLE